MRRPKLAEAKALQIEPSAADIIRFLKFVKQDGEHWIWTGHLDDNDYGQFKYKGTVIGAHRFSHAVFLGAIPTRRHVHHVDTCRVHNCVAPSHLQNLTQRKNSQEGVNHRWAKVAKAKQAKQHNASSLPF